MAEVTNELIYEVLKSMQSRMGKLEDGQKEIKAEIQAMRGYIFGISGDIANIYARLGHVEDRLDRVEKRLGLVDAELN